MVEKYRGVEEAPNKKNPEKLKISETIEVTEKAKIDLEKLRNMNHEEFLQIPFENRISFITKGNKKFEEIKTGKEKNLDFVFSFNGKLNQDLLKYVTLGQILPEEVAELTFSGKKYFRTGIEGEFFSEKGERLKILDGTKVEVSKLRTAKELETIKLENKSKENEFLAQNSEYNKEEFLPVVSELIKNGLTFDESKVVLTGAYDKISLLGVESGKRILSVVKYLKNKGFLDYSDAKEEIKDIEEILDILKKYGNKVRLVKNQNKRSKDDNEYNFELDKNFDSEPVSTQKFINVALSQIGVSEKDGGADKYFKEAGFGNVSSRKVPWCAAFINWVLVKSGFKSNGKLTAKSFINETGYGHVGIKVGDKMVSGNYGNKVGLGKLPSGIIGYALPTENGLKMVKGKDFDKSNIPDGAIVVMGRTKKQKHYA